jgi:hypothetical protein
MAEPPDTKPTLFRLALHHTPSPVDPEGAAELYQAIGTLIVAWGRLETHFLACIIAILQIPSTKGLSRKLPNAWDEWTKIWKDAFRISPDLKPYETTALQFLDEMQNVAELRNVIVHGLWEEFSAGPPVSAQVIRIKRRKDLPGGLEFFKSDPLTPRLVRSATQKASDLNIGLQTLSSILTALRGPLPPNVHII